MRRTALSRSMRSCQCLLQGPHPDNRPVPADGVCRSNNVTTDPAQPQLILRVDPRCPPRDYRHGLFGAYSATNRLRNDCTATEGLTSQHGVIRSFFVAHRRRRSFLDDRVLL